MSEADLDERVMDELRRIRVELHRVRDDIRVLIARKRIEAAAPKLLEACKETFWMLHAPEDSPRHWPASRANLSRLLTIAIADAEGIAEHEVSWLQP